MYRSYFLRTDQTYHFPKMATCLYLFFCVKCIYSSNWILILKDVSSLFQQFFLWPPHVLGGRPRAKCQVKKRGLQSEKESKALCRLWLIVPACRRVTLADDQIMIEALLSFVILWYVSVRYFFVKDDHNTEETKHFFYYRWKNTLGCIQRHLSAVQRASLSPNPSIQFVGGGGGWGGL